MEMPAYIILLLVVYSICFLFGVAGNCWVIVSLVAKFNRHRTLRFLKNQHIYIYVLSLSIVDLLVLAMIPVVISYFVKGSWQFGYIICKIFWIVENVNKLLSIAILTAMSFERYLAICRPFKWCCYRTRFSVMAVLISCLMVVVLLLGPVIYYADVKTFRITVDNGSVVYKTSCALEMPNDFLPTFIGYMFTSGFIIPATVLLICYSAMVRHVKASFAKRVSEWNYGQLTVHRLSNYTNRLIISILRVVLFHFACWTPFWLSVLLPLVVEFRNDSFFTSKSGMIGRLLIGCLPYVNCSFNWVFYALLNRDLRSFMIEQYPDWNNFGRQRRNATTRFRASLPEMPYCGRHNARQERENAHDPIVLVPLTKSQTVQEIVELRFESIYFMGVVQENLL